MYTSLPFPLPDLLTDGGYYAVIRENAGTSIYRDGKPVARNPFKFFVMGNHMPLSGRDLLILPEGERIIEQVWMFHDPTQSRTEQNPHINIGLQVNDKVRICEKAFQVQMIEDWQQSYVRARLARIDVNVDSIKWPDFAKESQ